MACKLFLLAVVLSCVAYIYSFPREKPLDNNPTFRRISDNLDKALGWGGYNDPKQSKVRATLHAAYHEAQHIIRGNPREHERAKDQWGVVTGGSRNNLKRYDQRHG